MGETDWNEEKGGQIFVGCMFVGMGIGFLVDHIPAGMFIGMGIGFIGKSFFKED